MKNLDNDEISIQSQDEYPLGRQSQASVKAAKEKFIKAKQKYNDELIIRNNQGHSDEGVREVLLVLEVRSLYTKSLMSLEMMNMIFQHKI